MLKFNKVEDARNFFQQDRFAVENGIEIDEIGPDSSVCSFVVGPRHVNAHGIVMGGAVFTLVDFSVAVATANRYWPTVTQQVSISYLSAARGSRVIARARCLRDSRSSCVYQVDVTDDTGRAVAAALVTAFKVQSHE